MIATDYVNLSVTYLYGFIMQCELWTFTLFIQVHLRRIGLHHSLEYSHNIISLCGLHVDHVLQSDRSHTSNQEKVFGITVIFYLDTGDVHVSQEFYSSSATLCILQYEYVAHRIRKIKT